MISDSLAGIPVTAAPDREQFKRIGRALAGRSDEDIIGRLPRLDPVQRNRALWALRVVGGPARLVQRAEEYKSGDPAHSLDSTQQLELISHLLDSPAQWEAIDLLTITDAGDLAALYADGTLDSRLRATFPA